MRIVRLCGLVVLFVLSIAMVSAAPQRAETTDVSCPVEGCHTFVPVSNYDVLPRLLSPVGGGAITSLAPTLLWSPIAPGNHHIQVSTDSSFGSVATLVIDSTRKVSKIADTPIATIVSSNLKPGIQYFWRVGNEYNGSVVYANAQSFITPAADAVTLPPLMSIMSPKNNAIFHRTSVTLQWQPVAGALLYRIRMADSTGKSVSQGTAYVDAPQTTFLVEGLQWRQSYTWKIRAYNQFGWGPYTDDYVFTTR